jgi:hypothetical protein
MSGLFGGGSGGSAPKTPALAQVNVPNTEGEALAADVVGYGLSDQDYAKRFPQLVAGRNYNVNNAVSNLQGQTDPAVSSALQTAGFGTPNLGSNEFQQAKSLGQPILAKEQRDRTYFQNLLQDNPQRAFGLSGGDVVNLGLANLGAANSYNQSIYGTRVQGANQAILQNAQNMSALYGALGSVGAAGIKSYANSQSPYLSYSQYSAPAYSALAADPYFGGRGS